MNYKLKFIPLAKKEWDKLDNSIKIQFKKKLRERVETPRVPKDKLSGYNDIYKIKLRNKGYRLVYEVKDDKIVIIVLTIAKRENDLVYKNLENLMKS